MELRKKRWNESLKKITPSVQRVLYKGNIDLLLDEAPKLAIVGTRRMTEYGRSVIERWIPALISRGITIVSGFMYGVDQAAHNACLENGGKTIAVLGWGIDRKPVAEDEKLYQRILEVDSLIVSEYEGELEGSRWTFPARNRIVAGISDAVLVIEGAERSGSMITARLARAFGKPLMAVPGQVTSQVAEGTNNLIRDGKAVLVNSADNVLSEMGLGAGQLKMGFGARHFDNSILAALESGEKSVDELSRILKKPVSAVMEEIFGLEMNGMVREATGKYFINMS